MHAYLPDLHAYSYISIFCRCEGEGLGMKDVGTCRVEPQCSHISEVYRLRGMVRRKENNVLTLGRPWPRE